MMLKLKVLLVDDEQEFVTTLAERLELRGMHVEIATDGEMALSIIETDPPQVVVLDVMMPGLGGMEVLQRIKTMDPNIQVILLTGRGSWDGIQGIREGAYDCLMKPIQIEELMQIMTDAVESNLKKQPREGG